MTTIKVKFRLSAVADREGTIYYQVTHERKARQLQSPYKVFPAEWDDRRSTVITTYDSVRKSVIHSIRRHIHCDIERLNRIDRRLDSTGVMYTVDDIIAEYTRYKTEYTLFRYMHTLISGLKQKGRWRTSETYTAALNSFRKFRSGEDIMLDMLTSEIVEGYELWLKSRHVTTNTISFYMRILRAAYNRAVDDGIIDGCQPFKRVYTGIDRTVKRAIPLSAIKRIRGLKLSNNRALDYARDIFMLSFYLRGMSFIDMAFLKKSDLNYGVITYRRRKTGQQLTIAWTKEMQQLVDKYPATSTGYLLPIITSEGVNERYAYRNAAYNINRNLKKIAPMAGVNIPLTLYVARHSWASVAKAKGIPLSIISEGMGHDSESTTRIYLASLDTSMVDRANSMIISSL